MSKEKKIYNFCGRKKLVGIIAAVFVLAAIIGTLILKIDVAIEFKGGTIITYTYDGDIDTNSVQKTISDSLGLKVKVGAGESLSTGEKNLTVSFTTKNGLTADRQSELMETLNKTYPDNNITLYDSNDVNPTTGKEFFIKCIVAVIFASLLIIAYVAIRFKKIGGLP